VELFPFYRLRFVKRPAVQSAAEMSALGPRRDLRGITCNGLALSSVAAVGVSSIPVRSAFIVGILPMEISPPRMANAAARVLRESWKFKDAQHVV